MSILTPTSSHAMPSDHHEQVHEAYSKLFDLPEHDRRRALAALDLPYDVVAEVESLLQQSVNSVFREDCLGYAGQALSAAALQDAPPETIGPYTILDVLGRGGMGTVYLAEQVQPVTRRVALKVIDQSNRSAEAQLRFELEVQALALMNHDSIAKVYDSGVTEGRPYFVMELVDGMPLTDFCDTHSLSLRDRLSLFHQVCEGIHHAHQKGLIHRDVKPANILVTQNGDRHVAKIIDFGIARTLDNSVHGEACMTSEGMMIGTLEYMSPEQALGQRDRVDTRTDVYSLGVVLYELLCGELPFPSGELRKLHPNEIQRRLRDVEPQKPSTRVSAHTEAGTKRASKRRISTVSLRKELRSDLDWIVLRAMAKEPERRYQSAANLAEDVNRYLNLEPVLAGPPSLSYRARKFIRRHRVQCAAAALVLLAITGGGAAAAIGFRRASERAEENATLAVAEQAAKTLLSVKIDEFDQLSGIVRYERSRNLADTLFPAWPSRLGDMDHWMADARELIDLTPTLEQTIAEIQSRAGSWSAAQRAADLKNHPRHSEWMETRSKVAAMRYAHAIRTNAQDLQRPNVPARFRRLHAQTLNVMARDRTMPQGISGRIYGEEALGLVLAEAVFRALKNTRISSYGRETLAWALLSNGQDKQALIHATAAVAEASPAVRAEFEVTKQTIEQHIETAEERLRTAEQRELKLDTEVHSRSTWSFASTADLFLHDALSRLLSDIGSLERDLVPRVETQRTWARGIEKWTRHHPNARIDWNQVRTSLTANERYGENALAWTVEDMLGLVPIGENPATGLWEFYHLRSAWDGESNPAELPIPVHGPDGSIALDQNTGIVFVLLPGGASPMGSQKQRPNKPCFDKMSKQQEWPLHKVELGPFLISRYETTQRQWARLVGGGTAVRQPSHFSEGLIVRSKWLIEGTNPVESVAWADCDRIARRFGLVIPTEARWEYACRAGTTDPWSFPLAQCAEYANIKENSPANKVQLHEPVGRRKGNTFGLYDVHGNVAEWCADYGLYVEQITPEDGQRQGAGRRFAIRGGSYLSELIDTRSSARHPYEPSFLDAKTGIRFARSLRRPQ